MRNKIQDLADHLFAQMERLSDETLTAEQLTTEIRRAGAIDRIANRMPVRLVHGFAAAIFAVLGVATLLGAGERWGF